MVPSLSFARWRPAQALTTGGISEERCDPPWGLLLHLASLFFDPQAAHPNSQNTYWPNFLSWLSKVLDSRRPQDPPIFRPFHPKKPGISNLPISDPTWSIPKWPLAPISKIVKRLYFQHLSTLLSVTMHLFRFFVCFYSYSFLYAACPCSKDSKHWRVLHQSSSFPCPRIQARLA